MTQAGGPQTGPPKNFDALYVNPALLQTAAAVCAKRLERDPHDHATLRSLADSYRKLGRLSEAAAAYGQLAALNPNERDAGYLRAILSGAVWPGTVTGTRPAPFVWLRNFLPSEMHDALLAFLPTVRDRFVPVDAGYGDYRSDLRLTLELTGAWDERQQFVRAVWDVLPTVIPRLYLSASEIDRLEVRVRAYLDGHFFVIHRDGDPDHALGAGRVINYVYYLHKTPRPYTGGDLLLFDSDPDVKHSDTPRFTRIVPEDNSIVFFPPNFYHCVVPVRCPSEEFADSRFVINGHARKPVPGVAQPRTSEAER
jgi:hypothetical protein